MPARVPSAVTIDTILAMVPDPIEAVIGRVISQWSIMEAILDSAIWRAAGLRNDVGRAITSQGQVQGKIDMLGAVLHQTHPRLAPQFEAVGRYIKECLAGRRNLVAHGLWGTSPLLMASTVPLAFVVKFAARGRLVDQGAIMTEVELSQLAREIAEVTSWLMQLSELLPPLKQRPGGLGHKTPDPPNPQACATRRLLLNQPPTRRPKAPPAPKTKGKPKAQPKRG